MAKILQWCVSNCIFLMEMFEFQKILFICMNMMRSLLTCELLSVINIVNLCEQWFDNRPGPDDHEEAASLCPNHFKKKKLTKPGDLDQ